LTITVTDIQSLPLVLKEENPVFKPIIIITMWGFQRGVDNLKIVDNFENNWQGELRFPIVTY